MNDLEARELLKDLLRASIQEAAEEALEALGETRNTPEGMQALSKELAKQLKQRGLALPQPNAVFDIGGLRQMSAGYQPRPGAGGTPKAPPRKP